MKRIERNAIESCKQYCFDNLSRIIDSHLNMEIIYRDDAIIISCYGDLHCGMPTFLCGRVKIEGGKLKSITDGSEYFNAYIKQRLE